MRTFLAIALAFFFATLDGHFARSAELSSITIDQLASILKKAGRNPTVKQTQDGSKFIEYEMKAPWNRGATATAYTFKNMGFRLYVGYSVPGADAAKVNEINWQWPYCHAYRDGDGVFVIRDVFAPGIAERNITETLKMFDEVAAAIFEGLQ